jgi:hypothetical protein
MRVRVNKTRFNLNSAGAVVPSCVPALLLVMLAAAARYTVIAE